MEYEYNNSINDPINLKIQFFWCVNPSPLDRNVP